MRIQWGMIMLVSLLSSNPAVASKTTPFDTARIREELHVREFDDSSDYSPDVLQYLEYYRLRFPGVEHRMGSFRSGEFRLVGHRWSPESSRGVVIVTHGYYDHVGIVRNAIDWALQSGFSVGAFDLPGHGLSTGARAAIDSFAQYATTLEDFLRHIPTTPEQPIILVGHSTGCAAIFEYLHTRKNLSVRKAVFLAPLVRGAYHHLSVVGFQLMKNFVETTTRWFRNASSDREFLRWFRQDPLQYDRFPIRWGRALYRWHDKIVSYEPSTIPLHIIQGIRDNVVDAEYNIPFLREKFTSVTVTMIPGARHQLLNESEEHRKKIRTDFLKELGRE